MFAQTLPILMAGTFGGVGIATIYRVLYHFNMGARSDIYNVANDTRAFFARRRKAIGEFIKSIITVRGKPLMKSIDDFHGKSTTIAYFDKSPKLVGDHMQNELIGVNAAFSEIKDDAIRKIILRSALAHDLLHEAGVDDEEILTQGDVVYTLALLEEESRKSPDIYQRYISELSHIADMGSAFPRAFMKALTDSVFADKATKPELGNIEAIVQQESIFNASQ